MTVKPLLPHLLSLAQPFAAKGCGSSDRSDIGKQDFGVVLLFQNFFQCVPLPPRLVRKEGVVLLLAVLPLPH